MKKLISVIALLLFAVFLFVGPGHAQFFDKNTSANQVCHAQWSFATDGGGAPGLITPATNCTIPANARIWGCAMRVTTAVTAGASGTITIGISNTGGGAAVLLGSTSSVSISAATNEQCVVVPQTSSGWVNTTTTGNVTITSGTAALTAGVIEIYIFYFVSAT